MVSCSIGCLGCVITPCYSGGTLASVCTIIICVCGRIRKRPQLPTTELFIASFGVIMKELHDLLCMQQRTTCSDSWSKKEDEKIIMTDMKNRETSYEQILAWRTEGAYEVFGYMYSYIWARRQLLVILGLGSHSQRVFRRFVRRSREI